MKKKIKNNKGFSLVELLVTMAVIAIVTIPLLQTFVVSNRINSSAKRTQNATDLAQNIAEQFSAISLDKLKSTYSHFDKDGYLVFQNIGDKTEVIGEGDAAVPYNYFEGADGERFYATVVLNSNDYKDINSVTEPNINSIYSTSNVVAFNQIKKYDSTVLTSFRVNKGIAASDIDYSRIKKTCNFYIDENQLGTGISYSYRLTVKYTYCSKVAGVYVPVTDASGEEINLSYDFSLGEGILSDTQTAPDLYIVYTPYDVNDSNHILASARDEVNVFYRQGSDKEDWEKNVNVCIVQQNVTHVASSGIQVSLVPDNVKMQAYNYTATETELYSKDDPNAVNMSIFSNITGIGPDFTKGSNSAMTLYSIDVYIRYDEPDGNDKIFYVKPDDATMSKILSDVFTSFSTIKGE